MISPDICEKPIVCLTSILPILQFLSNVYTGTYKKTGLYRKAAAYTRDHKRYNPKIRS